MSLEKFGLTEDKLRVAALAELERRRMAQVYLRDPFLFAKYVCAEPDQRALLGPFHRQGLEWLRKATRRRKLILWPRGHLKSTLFTIGESLRAALIYPNIRVLISCQKVENAKTYLLGIKKIMSDPFFQSLYGNLIPPSTAKEYKNNDTMLSIFHPKKSKAKEATFVCTGPDAEKTGQHYDRIIHDDVVWRETVTNQQQREKTYQYYKDCVSLLDPPKPGNAPPEIIVIGTRWHTLDLYWWLMDGATDPRCRETRFENGHAIPNCMCRWDVTLRAVKENGAYIWPEVFNDEYMDGLIIGDGLDAFSVGCQYYNNPTDQDACWFKASDIEAAKIDPQEITALEKKDDLVWYVAIDPAESTSSRACLSAAVAVGVSKTDGTWYVDWAEGRRVETPGFVALAMEAYERHAGKIVKYGLETHTKRALLFDLKQAMFQTGKHFSIEELKPNKVGDATRTKEMRIKRLAFLFEHKKIRINRYLKDLIDELYTLPSAMHQDLADALAYVMDLVPPEMGMSPGPTRLPRRTVAWTSCGY